MTDLEDLWESYPASKPPTAELLREGRRQARLRRRRLVLRPLVAAATATALGAAFLVGTSVGPGQQVTPASPHLPAARMFSMWPKVCSEKRWSRSSVSSVGGTQRLCAPPQADV